jgi:serine/threonine protein kinase
LPDLLSQTVGRRRLRARARRVGARPRELLEYIPEALADLLQAGRCRRRTSGASSPKSPELLASAQRILHRDLKPENILSAGPPLSLAPTDFGIASPSAATHFHDCGADHTRAQALTGVPDAKSDWWSLGMINRGGSGRHPFEGPTSR